MLILRHKIHTHKSKPVFEVLYLEKWCGSEVCKMNVTGSLKRLSYKIPSELFRKKSRLYYAQVCVSLHVGAQEELGKNFYKILAVKYKISDFFLGDTTLCRSFSE